MNGKWLKLILAASLALNVAFLAPILYRQLIRPDSANAVPKATQPAPTAVTGETNQKNTAPPTEEIPKHSPLRPNQREQIDALIRSFRMEMMNYKQEILAKRIEIIDELGNPEYDPQTVTALTVELNELENKLNLLFAETLIKVDAHLDEDQRLDFLYKLSQRWFFRPPKRPGTSGEQFDGSDGAHRKGHGHRNGRGDGRGSSRGSSRGGGHGGGGGGNDRVF